MLEWPIVKDVLSWLHKNWAKVKPWVTPVALSSRIPRDPFRIVLDTRDPPWWHMGSMRNEPAMQIHSRYFVTNTAKENILIVGGKLKPEIQNETYDVLLDFERVLFDGEKTNTNLVTAQGFIHPPVVKEGMFSAQIIFIDQYGNETLGPLTAFKHI